MQTVEQVKEALRKALPVTSLAALIRVAIEDGRAMLAEREHVLPDWSTWYRSRSYHGPCTACFGGAVMLGTLDGIGKFRLAECDVIGSHQLHIQYKPEQVAALCALDRVRRGDLRGAYSALGMWYRGDGKRCPKVEAFRDAVLALVERRRTRQAGVTGVTSAPAQHEFKTRQHFGTFLDGVEEIADEVGKIEADHLKEAA